MSQPRDPERWLDQVADDFDYKAFPQALERAAAQGDPLARALLQLDSRATPRAWDAVEARLGELAEPVERAVALACAVSLVHRERAPAEAIVGRCRSAYDRTLAIESAGGAAARRARALIGMFLAEDEGAAEMRRERVAELLALLPPGSLAQVHVLTRMGMSAALSGSLRALPWLRERWNDAAPQLPPAMVSARFADAVEACRIPEAHALLPELDRSAYSAQHATFLRWYQGMLYVAECVLAGRRPEERYIELAKRGVATQEASAGAEPLTRSIDHLGAIAANDAAAMAAIAADHVPCTTPSSLAAFNPLRAALALRDEARAGDLLERRAAAGRASWLDGLFRARRHLLRGERDIARAEIETTVRHAQALQALARLDLELRLAHELAPADLLAAVVAPLPAHPAPPADRGIVGASAHAARVRSLVERYAPAELPVLVTGATGTGKDVVARALHRCSPRAEGPLVSLNCSAINDTIAESELFGHVRGAFSGADRDRRGLVTEAGAGTLFLDEIGDATPRFQALLLRVLESGEYRAVGSNRAVRAVCRVIAATNADLAALVAQGRFRADLWYRLRRLEIHLEPLAERREDVVPLTLHLLAADGTRRGITEALAAHLRALPWPGNVRELRNDLERMVVAFPAVGCFDVHHHEAVRGGHAAVAPPAAASSSSSGAWSAIRDAPDAGYGPVVERRRDRLRDLFRQHGRLTRKDVCRLLDVSPNTASADLDALCGEGAVEKVTPSRAPKSFYYRSVASTGG